MSLPQSCCHPTHSLEHQQWGSRLKSTVEVKQSQFQGPCSIQTTRITLNSKRTLISSINFWPNQISKMGQNNKGDGGETKWNGGGKWKWSTSVQMFDWDRRSYVEFENTPRILRQIFAYTEQSAELTHRRTNQLQAFGTRWGRTTMVMEGAPHGILMETMNEEVSSRGGEPTIEMLTTESHMFVFQDHKCHQPGIPVFRSTLPGFPGDDSFTIRASVSMRLDRSLVCRALDFISVPEHQSREKSNDVIH